MTVNFFDREIETDDFLPVSGRVRVTEESPHPRVKLIKEERLHHKKNTSLYLVYVLVTKYIDGNQVNQWSWMEELPREEVSSFPGPQKPSTYRSYLDMPEEYQERKRAYAREQRRKYREAHRDEINRRNKEYMRRRREGEVTPRTPLTEEERKEKNREKARRYYQQHKEELQQKKRENYYKNKERNDERSKQYYQEHKENWKTKYNNYQKKKENGKTD